MRANSFFPDELKQVFRIGIYAVVSVIGFAVTLFILWALSCIGSACWEFIKSV